MSDRDALAAAAAVSALIDAAERDFRKVFPEPHMLAANLALAVQARKVIAALTALPSPHPTPPGAPADGAR